MTITIPAGTPILNIDSGHWWNIHATVSFLARRVDGGYRFWFDRKTRCYVPSEAIAKP